jgi:hypothetical protein
MIFDRIKCIVNLCNRWRRYQLDAKCVSYAKSSNGDIYLLDAECVSQAKSSQAKPSQAKPSQAKPSQAKPSDGDSTWTQEVLM